MPKLPTIATALTASPALAEPEPVKATADFQEALFTPVAEIEAAEVSAFEFVTVTKQKIVGIRNEDVVVRQLVNVASGAKAQAEIGRAEVVKTEVR